VAKATLTHVEMSYHVVMRWGGSEDEPDESRMREILAELDVPDPEHPDTWMTHESSGWTLSIFEGGLVIWKKLGASNEKRHQVGVSRERALELWLKLSRGELDAIEQEPWRPGQSPPRTAEEQAEIVRRAEEMTLAEDRQFYERLGRERENVSCRRAGCEKGAIPLSAFCRAHHFENIRHRHCPFDY
jgi:hypothetical protein